MVGPGQKGRQPNGNGLLILRTRGPTGFKGLNGQDSSPGHPKCVEDLLTEARLLELKGNALFRPRCVSCDIAPDFYLQAAQKYREAGKPEKAGEMEGLAHDARKEFEDLVD